MQLYIVRHGIAIELGEFGVAQDPKRPLSDEGREKTKEVAQGLQVLRCKPDRIGSSPLLRARQTAEILAAELAPGAEIETCDAMAPAGDFADLARWIKGKDTEQALVVGHMPDVARFASFALAGTESLDLEFRKSAVCCLAFDRGFGAGKARLEWLMQPRQLRRLGRA